VSVTSERDGITGTRSKAETKRALVGRIMRAAACADYEVTGTQMRHMLNALAVYDEPTDEHVIETLMRAPWFPKHKVRQWRVGEAGWRVRS
jgi:hypothetical protein